MMLAHRLRAASPALLSAATVAGFLAARADQRHEAEAKAALTPPGVLMMGTGEYTTGFVGASVDLAKRVGRKATSAVKNAAVDFADAAADHARALDDGGGLRLQYNSNARGERLRDKAYFASAEAASTLLEMGILGK